jgi:excinuclease UvrABC ATPase subunit
MQQEYIVIQGARENNLKNVNLKIPKRKITIFTGVSGSGKSSIVFDTISTEAQRQLNETFTFFVRNFLPKYSQPDADAIENLSTAIVVDQKRLGGNSRSTVGTITDILPVFRILFSRIGKPHHGYAYAFSFNDPGGMCPECGGVGKKVGLDLEKFLDPSKSLNEGAILFPVFAVGTWYWNTYAHSGYFDADKKIKDYTPEEYDLFLYGKDKKFDLKSDTGALLKVTYEGVVERFNRLYIKRDISALAESTRKKLEPFMSFMSCPACKGTRLNPSVLACKIGKYNIADMAAMEVNELIRIVREITDPIAAPVITTLIARLHHLIAIGLGYLSLDRETTSLSGGESQRIKMVKHLSSNLTDMIYIFDEPSIGLHPRDVHRLNALLRQLRDKGNTILVVEHDPDVISIADHIVDVGPYAGTQGGEIVYEGSFKDLLQTETLTGKYLRHTTPIKTNYRLSKGSMKIEDASVHNLQHVTVEIPKGVLTVVTGVAGSGKSSLIHHAFLKKHPEAIVIDQSAVSTSIRSTPATYTGVMDDIRQLFAQKNKVSASLFSFNSKGACENCQGVGFIYTDLAFLEPIKTPCEICQGKRFKEEVLRYTYKDKSISDVLHMTIAEALHFFDKKELKHKLQAIFDVGLYYLTLGQPLSTLSGGECQRIKIATELHKQGSIYVMDEPTTGLHLSDIEQLLKIMNRLVDNGNSVIAIEHNLEIIKNGDWIIDLGPDGGNKGGHVIFEGTPAQLINAENSITGKYLREVIEKKVLSGG